jgi:hypothetical protein
MGRTETVHLLEEARQVFVNGHFAATLMLAISVVEHCVVEECQLRGLFKKSPKKSSTLSRVLQIAQANTVLPIEWFPELELLVRRRNPFAHLKDPSHAHGLGRRARTEKRHPREILEADAELAVKYMYQVFHATLREAAGQTRPATAGNVKPAF